MTAEAACGIALPRRVGRAPAAHTFGVLLTPKVHCTGLLDARRRHAEIGEATHATVAEVA
ncbi:hypothetical protein AB0K15_34295 [Amycolatopsis sp. NPDC049253]|uniref:hypothetical protein n=1 Tax=Amycolatopsis sp. NPDC049253 TaxID=3155274 RepID=UPI00344AD2EB